MTGSRTEIRAGPQGRHPLQNGELLSQDTAGFALEAPHNLIGCPLWGCRNEQMEMVGQDVERQYLTRHVGSDLVDKRVQACFQPIHQDGAPPFGAPDQVVVDEKHAGVFGVVHLFHSEQYTTACVDIQVSSTHQQRASSHP